MTDNKNVDNIHLLLVEDNPGYLSELLDWLREEFGYHNIETASNASQAREKLADPFDIIISDMRMERDDSGFEIIEEVKSRNLSSVVIILTANETVSDCRRSFRMGAWDYISKNMRGNVFEALNESIQDAIAYFNRWGNLENDRWIEDNIEDLERDYFGQYIAVINKSVIESADTEEELDRRIEERKIRRFLTTVRKIGELKPIADIAALPESNTLEFKSTLQWDVRENRQNKNLRFSVLKTIAAFLNSDGGTLLIGVEDNGQIYGLEKDLELLSNSLDRFERLLVDLIGSCIGNSFMQNINIRFDTIEGKNVCAIAVKKSVCPAFLLEAKNKPEFYIRVGNASKSLNPQEFYDYLQQQQNTTGNL